MTHPTWNLELESGGLVLTPCPGTKGVDLEASLQQLKDEGVQAVVTALDNAELASKAVSDLGEITERLGMKWFQIEIEDDCAPSDAFTAKWQKASPELHKILNQGSKVALHCMGGSGRTGLFAAHLLLEKGWELADIIREVQALRPGAFTKPVQVDYIERVAG
ncbi:putative CDK2-ASSOCIATED DUAL SPECIFICITY PHOSPHATASE (KINASE ASSOCIATED PHOSPHATASE) [Vibrio nigripulchritudo SOn1]|uniref:CDK2-ASSOCIATED DUAL SPECIFICITY PHOSPHATASE (KINASE ASSOCIATED PHOSPHATASE) n=1 Tax=Vibrio nigripulchritudo SOn1 TaxID=1238450 RepID=A0AAV2VTC7_9VIBR|nr:cyclin-dependent kinase inhibitor 3 family protein [Vibrio nigripulchritudo]CCO47668.1 putative CDK2-ASSOCIATED DUAL SPECIFICITY PHOSPHATASE (KINASE ASSOCIATED PHOSPHATASE) [Vibrio nigripulchritudo SOn1]